MAPIAMPVMAGISNSLANGQISQPARIIDRLRKTGAIAGIKNSPSELRMPIEIAAHDTASRNGNMMRVMVTVTSNFSGFEVNSGARVLTSSGLAIIPTSVSMPTTTRMAQNVRLVSLKAFCCPSFSRIPLNVGTKAALIAPSANRSRNRFGIRKATLKASVQMPAPKR